MSSGFDIRKFDSIDSTNRYLLDEAAAGAPALTVAVTGHQTEGRGRRGRVWDSKPGSSLLFSTLFRPAVDEELSRYPQAVALAVTDACSLVGGFAASLKWPNDVLVGERKLGGILAEATTGTQVALVVGCGLNLNWGEELSLNLPQAISANDAAGRDLDRDEMLEVALDALAARLAKPEQILNDYRERCSTIGKQVRIQRTASDLLGKVLDVTPTGALLLETEFGTEEVAVGEAVHLRPS